MTVDSPTRLSAVDPNPMTAANLLLELVGPGHVTGTYSYTLQGAGNFTLTLDLTRLPCSYSLAVSMFTEDIPWLKGEDLELVMGRALCEWIGWKALL